MKTILSDGEHAMYTEQVPCVVSVGGGNELVVIGLEYGRSIASSICGCTMCPRYIATQGYRHCSSLLPEELAADPN